MAAAWHTLGPTALAAVIWLSGPCRPQLLTLGYCSYYNLLSSGAASADRPSYQSLVLAAANLSLEHPDDNPRTTARRHLTWESRYRPSMAGEPEAQVTGAHGARDWQQPNFSQGL
ncbi:Hypothetical predicted protein [Pelobates cultripes]|uniref:Uncharacterized protein n=1 Tax=Pelobates cultripes TaxID=61616 RepID=A0AAD1WC94_PELCU|nr:Hypothetical predicted protein [Pelobates cultripes]